MREDRVHRDGAEYAKYLLHLRSLRRRHRDSARSSVKRRLRLSGERREQIKSKTGGRCHLCGEVLRDKWDVDHLNAHSRGGSAAADNCLPACKTCNNYRWDYTSEEMRELMKLGVWVRRQIEDRSGLGVEVADKFVRHEQSRMRRRV